jgi:hypothetical protein
MAVFCDVLAMEYLHSYLGIASPIHILINTHVVKAEDDDARLWGTPHAIWFQVLGDFITYIPAWFMENG